MIRIDALERILFETKIAEIQDPNFLTIPHNMPIAQALRVMSDNQAAIVLVAEADRLVGILTERDVFYKVAANYDQVCQQSVQTVMTSRPVVVYDDATAATALCAAAAAAYHHVPVLSLEGRITGIVMPISLTSIIDDHLQEN